MCEGERGGFSTRYPAVIHRFFHSVLEQEMSWLILGLNLLLASCALWAAITARSHLKALTRLLSESSTRSVKQLDAEVAELTSGLSSISTTVKRLSSRIGMQDLRERRATSSQGQLPQDPKMRKSQLKMELAQGKAVVIRDGG